MVVSDKNDDKYFKSKNDLFILLLLRVFLSTYDF